MIAETEDSIASTSQMSLEDMLCMLVQREFQSTEIRRGTLVLRSSPLSPQSPLAANTLAPLAAAADEADVFASDFASTDDEADAQAADDADRTLQREEAAAEREARARRFHDPLAQAKRKLAPITTATATASSTNAERNKRRRVAYVETEEVFPGLWEEPPERMRAVRTSTIAQKAEVDTRLKKAMATKVCSCFSSFDSAPDGRPQRPPPPPKQHLKLSQSDLIDLALELETTNRRELEDWLEKEEERRRSVMVRRSVVKGERVTWISRTVTVEPNTRPTTTDVQAQARALTPTVPPPQQQQTTRYERNLLNLFQIERGKELDVIFGDHADWKAVPVLPNKRAQRTSGYYVL